MHRFDELETKTELSFLVGFSDHIALNNCKKELQQKYPSVSISFLDSKGLYAP